MAHHAGMLSADAARHPGRALKPAPAKALPSADGHAIAP